MSEDLKPNLETSVDISQTMSSAYLEYAMSVIVGRALPDVRDGLKPVHRRVLYVMQQLNLSHSRPYMKSARIVGEVIGKYHPHGEVAVYEAAVRMAQDFSMRYPLIDGQGNFGSVDGDMPAAMRYTEVRFQKISQELLADIDKKTVDFVENYDGSLQEPTVLPSKLPLLLINGSSGIAVGMATNIPPHNLGEIVDALEYMIEVGSEANDKRLLEIVKGPDFPTAGMILGTQGIRSAYTTGKGIVKVRAKTNIEDDCNLIITELPYMVNKARLIEKISYLVKEKKIQGIQDIRDESDRQGMRIFIKIKKGISPEIVENNLYKFTSMQSSFGINCLAVSEGQPQVMSLKKILTHFLDHRVEIVNRRTRFDLEKSKARIHILEGLRIAISNIDPIVEQIKTSLNAEEAKKLLKITYQLSDTQSQSILEMRLQRLTGLERGKIETEYRELKEKIKYFEHLLAHPEEILQLIKKELQEIKADYADERKTVIHQDSLIDIEDEDLITKESMVVTMSNVGYIKRIATTNYTTQNRGGKGKIGMTTKEDDFVEHMFVASTHDYILMFSNLGKMYSKRVFELPLVTRISKGRMIINFLPLTENEKIISFLPVSSFDLPASVVMITQKGIIKKTTISAYKNFRVKGTKAIVIDEDDRLITAKLCFQDDLIFISTKRGMALKFPSSHLRDQGRATRGCRGIRFRMDGDQVVGLETLKEDNEILTIAENGMGKRSLLKNYRLGSRDNKGVMNLKVDEKNGLVVNSLALGSKDEFLLITNSGKVIRIDSSQVRQTLRVAKGVRIIRLDEGEKVVSIAKILPIEV